MGVGTGSRRASPLDFEMWHFPVKFLARKGCFLVLNGWNKIFCSFWFPAKIFLVIPGKFTIGPSVGKILPTPVNELSKQLLRIQPWFYISAHFALVKLVGSCNFTSVKLLGTCSLFC